MKSLLIAVAIDQELKIIKNSMSQIKPVKSEQPMFSGLIAGFPIEVIQTSMGPEAAAKAAIRAINPDRHGGVFILGYCGGLSNTLKVSDVVIASKVISPFDSKMFSIEPTTNGNLGKALIQEGVAYRCAPLLSQKLVVQTRNERQKLNESTHAEAVDMEASEITRHALEKNLKVAAIKILIDDIDTEMPDFNEYYKKTGKMDKFSVTQTLASRPALNLRLSNNIRQAGIVLKKIIPVVIPSVCRQWGITPH